MHFHGRSMAHQAGGRPRLAPEDFSRGPKFVTRSERNFRLGRELPTALAGARICRWTASEKAISTR